MIPRILKLPTTRLRGVTAAARLPLGRRLLPVPALPFSKRDTKKWLNEHKNDPYVLKSVAMDFRSRAAFKLIEIDDKHHLLRKPTRILELGACPGGWTQVVLRRGNPSAKVLAIDREKLKPFENPLDRKNPNFQFIQADVFDTKTSGLIKQFFGNQLAQLVICDMAPNIAGDGFQDAIEIHRLNAACLDICQLILETGGTLLMKTFHNFSEQTNNRLCSLYFRKVTRIKPASSRAKSPELYYLCQGHQQSPFFDLIAQKGYDISLEEFSRYMPDLKEFSDKEMKEFLQSITERAEKEGIKEKNLKFQFEKELWAQRLPVESKKTVRFSELEEDLDRIYQVAKQRKLIDEIPSSNPAEMAEEMERKSIEWSREMKELMDDNPRGKMELLDLDEERARVQKEQEIDADNLPGDFKYHWQSNYDDYLFEEFKVEVLGKLRNKDKRNEEQEHEQRMMDLAAETGKSVEEIEKAVEEQIELTEQEFDPWLGDDEKLKRGLEELEVRAGKSKEWDPIEESSFVEARLKQAAAKKQKEAKESGASAKDQPKQPEKIEDEAPLDVKFDPRDLMEQRKNIEELLAQTKKASNAIQEDADRQLSTAALTMEDRRDRRLQTVESKMDREAKEKVRSVDSKREKQRLNPKKSK